MASFKQFCSRSHDMSINRITSASGRHRCKICATAMSKEWSNNHPKNRLVIQRRKLLKKKYGITLEQYDELLKSQDGRCAICRCFPGKKHLAVDHNHETGRIRGLLCTRCNSILVVAFENYEFLFEDARSYLRNWD